MLLIYGYIYIHIYIYIYIYISITTYTINEVLTKLVKYGNFLIVKQKLLLFKKNILNNIIVIRSHCNLCDIKV